MNGMMIGRLLEIWGTEQNAKRLSHVDEQWDNVTLLSEGLNR